MLFPPGQADVFWMNIKSLLDGGQKLPNVAVILFAMLGDQPSGLAITTTATSGSSCTPPQFTGRSRVEFASSESQPLRLALDMEEYNELWQSFETSRKFTGLFQDRSLLDYLYGVMGGHVSDGRACE